MANERSYTGGRFMVDIDGYNVAFVKKFEGLHMEADIATHDHGPENFQSKHVANVKWAPGKISVGAGMGAGMKAWIQAAFDKAYITKGGRIVAADFNYKAQSEMTFQGGLITSVAFPKLDASAKEALYLDIEFEAEQVRWAKGDGSDIRGKYGKAEAAWQARNFRFEMGGLPCSRVTSVDAWTLKCAVAADHIGIHTEPTKHPAKVTVPDVKISVSMADYQPWADAANKWFVGGEHLANHEMQGAIVLLDPNMSKEIGRVELINCGFKKFSKQPFEANSEKIARFDVEFYVEQMKFNLGVTDA